MERLSKIDEIDTDNNDMAQKIHINISLDIMMLMSLDPCVEIFSKDWISQQLW